MPYQEQSNPCQQECSPPRQRVHRKEKRATKSLSDWRSISDDREKYQAYLCSREWAEKKAAVHKRAGNKCERCRVLPINAVHHLTYARKYDESLDDLQGICNACHAFTHGKDGFDPKPWGSVLKWLVGCTKELPPMPFEIAAGLEDFNFLAYPLNEIILGGRILHAAGLDNAAGYVLSFLPFVVPRLFYDCGAGWWDPSGLSVCYRLTGWTNYENPDWFSKNATNDEG